MIERRECGMEPGIVIEHGLPAIYVGRCADLFRCQRKIYFFAEKVAITVVKRMHEEER